MRCDAAMLNDTRQRHQLQDSDTLHKQYGHTNNPPECKKPKTYDDDREMEMN
jgi:hypothetical protein